MALGKGLTCSWPGVSPEFTFATRGTASSCRRSTAAASENDTGATDISSRDSARGAYSHTSFVLGHYDERPQVSSPQV